MKTWWTNSGQYIVKNSLYTDASSKGQIKLGEMFSSYHRLICSRSPKSNPVFMRITALAVTDISGKTSFFSAMAQLP